VSASERFLAETSHRGVAVVLGDDVVVTVSIDVSLPLLASAGVSATTVTGRGAAHIVRGISEAET
jgi:hypothetical protein